MANLATTESAKPTWKFGNSAHQARHGGWLVIVPSMMRGGALENEAVLLLGGPSKPCTTTPRCEAGQRHSALVLGMSRRMVFGPDEPPLDLTVVATTAEVHNTHEGGRSGRCAATHEASVSPQDRGQKSTMQLGVVLVQMPFGRTVVARTVRTPTARKWALNPRIED